MIKAAKDLGHRARNNILGGLASVLISRKPLEDLKSDLNKSLEYLQSLEEFSSKQVSEHLDNLILAECDSPHDLGIYLVEKGFGQMFTKMWNDLSGSLLRNKWNSQGFTNLRNMMIAYMCVTNGSCELGEQLITLGCIGHLFSGLDQLTEELGGRNETGRKLVDPILGILQNVIRLNSTHRNTYREHNGVALLKKCLELPNKELKTDSLLILAYIVDETESQILSEKGVVSILVDLVRYAVKSSKHLAFVSTGYYTALELLDGLNRLAVNDDNKVVIETHDGVPAIIRMLSDDFSDEEKLEAAKALWNLAFLESIRHSNLYRNMIKSLSKYLTSENEELRQTCASAIWQLKVNDSKPHKEPPSYQEAVAAGPQHHRSESSQIMISYQWDSQKRALQIRDKLVTSGYKVWMDVTHMKGDILSAMAQAVESSKIILICMTEKYKESRSCRSEATYAYKLQKGVIPLLLESGYKPDGWLGILQGMDIYYHFHTAEKFDDNFAELLKVIAESHFETCDDNVDGDTSTTTIPAAAVNDEQKVPPPSRSARDWSKEDVQIWLQQIQLPELCSTFDFCNGNHLEMLYDQHCQNPQGFKEEMKTDYDMTAKIHLQFTVALKQLFHK